MNGNVDYCSVVVDVRFEDPCVSPEASLFTAAPGYVNVTNGLLFDLMS